MQADRERTARRIQDAISQEALLFARTLAGQLGVLSKYSGPSLKELPLIPNSSGSSPGKTACLDASLRDKWLASFADSCLEVELNKENDDDIIPLGKLTVAGDFSSVRFDACHRLWLCSRDGLLEVLDVRRSVLQNCPLRYTLAELEPGTAHCTVG